MSSGEQVGKLLDELAGQLGLRVERHGDRATLVRPDGTSVKAWCEDYPYPRRLHRKEYLLAVQRGVRSPGAGRDVSYGGRARGR